MSVNDAATASARMSATVGERTSSRPASTGSRQRPVISPSSVASPATRTVPSSGASRASSPLALTRIRVGPSSVARPWARSCRPGQRRHAAGEFEGPPLAARLGVDGPGSERGGGRRKLNLTRGDAHVHPGPRDVAQVTARVRLRVQPGGHPAGESAQRLERGALDVAQPERDVRAVEVGRLERGLAAQRSAERAGAQLGDRRDAIGERDLPGHGSRRRPGRP